MTSPSILPDNVNTLLIRNENVWTNGRYWKITFSDPLFLKQLLRNEISRDSLDRPVACHSMKPGHFFVVETERFRYTCVSRRVPFPPSSAGSTGARQSYWRRRDW